MDVSVVDLTVRLSKDASYEEIMTACRRAADGELKVRALSGLAICVVTSDVLHSSTCFFACKNVIQ